MKYALAACLLMLLAAPALAGPPPDLTFTPLLSWQRVYPYVGLEQRWTFDPLATDESNLLWTAGAAYSLGRFAPAVGWRWNPEPGADVNELYVRLNVNLRSLF